MYDPNDDEGSAILWQIVLGSIFLFGFVVWVIYVVSCPGRKCVRGEPYLDANGQCICVERAQ